MSHIISTDIGRFRSIRSDGVDVWQFECPGCGKWGTLDEDQWNGRVSVDHTSAACRYHETHDYRTALLVGYGRALFGVAPSSGAEGRP